MQYVSVMTHNTKIETGKCDATRTLLYGCPIQVMYSLSVIILKQANKRFNEFDKAKHKRWYAALKNGISAHKDAINQS